MQLERCANGHFYDEEKYTRCPHCNDDTKNMKNTNDERTIMDIKGSSSLADNVRTILDSRTNTDYTDYERTIGFYQKTMGTDPVVGWLVAIEGEHRGEDFRLKSGRNFIGRSSSMDVVLGKDNSVAREKHAAVVFDPKSTNFLAQAGDSKELFYINDDVILTVQELNPLDVITVGETKLMFVPFCGKDFTWSDATSE